MEFTYGAIIAIAVSVFLGCLMSFVGGYLLRKARGERHDDYIIDQIRQEQRNIHEFFNQREEGLFKVKERLANEIEEGRKSVDEAVNEMIKYWGDE